jgi:Bacterial PH domain
MRVASGAAYKLPVAMAVDIEARVAYAIDSKLDSGTRWLLRRELAKLPLVLPEGEEIEYMAQGRVDGGTGLVLVTDRRLMFFEQGIAHRRIEDFPFEVVSTVQVDVSVVASVLEIATALNEARIERLYPKPRTMEIAEYVRGRIAAPGESGHSLGRPPQRT